MNHVIAFDFPAARHTDIYCWLDQLGIVFSPVTQEQFDWKPPPGTRLLVTAQAYSAAHINVLIEAQKQGIQTLLLADGILEFRNTYRNPNNTPGSMFMPLVADKMACISRMQAARVESWGNPGRCEVIGLPMMDRVKRTPPPRPRSKPFRLLIATAQTPWFDDKQREIVLKSLADLRDTVQQIDELEVWWRLAPQAVATLGVVNHVPRFQDMKMDACIDHVDAVISTPSTLLLYPMLQGKPAVSMDYTRSPAYMQTAWSITAPEHMLQTINEIQNPPGDKLWFQRQTLDDHLEWAGSATRRLGTLIKRLLKQKNKRTQIRKTAVEPPPLVSPVAVNSMPQTALELSRFFKWTDAKKRSKFNSRILFLKSKLALEKQFQENSELFEQIKALLSGKDWLEQQYKTWKEEAAKLKLLMTEKDNYIKELLTAKKWLDEQRTNWMTEASNSSALIQEKDAYIKELESAKEYLEQQCKQSLDEIEKLKALISDKDCYVKELLVAKKSIEDQYKNWITEVSKLSVQLKEKIAWIEKLESC